MCCNPFAVSAGSFFNVISAYQKMRGDMDQKAKPLISMCKEEREEIWDDIFTKEEGI